jgi:hypothetical protein
VGVNARTHRLLWAACLEGREPAEALPTLSRQHLVGLLAARGWSVVEIAAWTRMTTYTTGRILERVATNPLITEEAA